MAVFFTVLPVWAFTSLQSCYQSPACVKELGAAGLLGTPAGAASSGGAVAANNIAVPVLAAGAVAYRSYDWGQGRADELAAPYVPPFEGGQCSELYFVDWEGYAGDTQVSSTVDDQILGPVGVGSENENAFITSVGERVLGTTVAGNSSAPARIDILSIDRVDGGPDSCGSPPPEKDLDSSPITSDDLDSLLPSPVDVPWPDPLPGEDGLLGTDDDIFPPLTIPGPVIAPNSIGEPEYYPSGLTLPNGNDPNVDPAATDPQSETNDRLENIEDLLREQNENSGDGPEINLDPPPGQSSGCDGWGYGICQLQDNFPFDIFGTLPASSAPPCPQFTFFGQSSEFCFVTDLLSYLKWIVGISASIYAVMVL